MTRKQPKNNTDVDNLGHPYHFIVKKEIPRPDIRVIYKVSRNSQGIPVSIVGKLFVVCRECTFVQNSQLLDPPSPPFLFFATTWCIYLRQPVDILDETILIKCNHDNKFQSISAKIDMNPSNNLMLFPQLFWPSVRKILFYWSRKTFEIQGWRPRICKIFWDH